MLIAQPDEAYTSPRRGEGGGVTDIRLALVCVWEWKVDWV